MLIVTPDLKRKAVIIQSQSAYIAVFHDFYDLAKISHFTVFSSHKPKILISSSTFVMPAMPKLSTRTFATFGDRNAGSVGPR